MSKISLLFGLGAAALSLLLGLFLLRNQESTFKRLTAEVTTLREEVSSIRADNASLRKDVSAQRSEFLVLARALAVATATPAVAPNATKAELAPEKISQQAVERQKANDAATSAYGPEVMDPWH